MRQAAPIDYCFETLSLVAHKAEGYLNTCAERRVAVQLVDGYLLQRASQGCFGAELDHLQFWVLCAGDDGSSGSC